MIVSCSFPPIQELGELGGFPGSSRIKCCLFTYLKAASFCSPDPQPNEAQEGKEEAAAQGGEAGHAGYAPEGTHEVQSSYRVRLEFCRSCCSLGPQL